MRLGVLTNVIFSIYNDFKNILHGRDRALAILAKVAFNRIYRTIVAF
jgi:hypothetical protein